MKIRKELWFGFILMALIIAGTAVMLLAAPKISTGHLGLMMLALVVVAIMLGFPTAFTLMGMGMIFTWIAYDGDAGKTLTLMVQSAFKVMGNDVLISIPLFVFMGYLVERRANLIDKLFKSLHLGDGARARIAGGGHALHLRRLRHGHRHRGCGGHADGAARAAADAQGRL